MKGLYTTDTLNNSNHVHMVGLVNNGERLYKKRLPLIWMDQNMQNHIV